MADDNQDNPTENKEVGNLNNTSEDPASPIELSRHERKKLRKQESKGQQQDIYKQQKRKKIIKNSLIYGISLIVLIGLGYLFVVGGKDILPTADDDPFLGPSDAALEIIEFGDFQCPFTRNFNTGAFKDIMKEYDGKIRWVFKDMVTGKHLFSTESAIAANCANEQGKFWEFHDMIFARKGADEQSLKSYAQQLGLDMQQFNSCYDSRKYAAEVKDDYKQGKKASVTITPTFFVNGYKMQGDLTAAQFKAVLNDMLKQQGIQ